MFGVPLDCHMHRDEEKQRYSTGYRWRLTDSKKKQLPEDFKMA